MPHGLPDWGLVGPRQTTYGLDDVGEAAVRLGSPVLWDRRGDVLYATDFSEGIGSFQTQVSGASARVALHTEHSRHGAYSVGLHAGSDGGRYALLHLALPFQFLSAVGLEASFSLHNETEYLGIRFHWFDGAYKYSAGLRIEPQVPRLVFMHSGGGWGVLEDPFPRHLCWRPEHTAKVVADMAAQRYVRILVDERTYDMRAYDVVQAVDVRAPYWYFVIIHGGLATCTPYVYVDNVIVTQNEPV